MSQKNLKDVRTMNRANVLRLVCENHGITRQEVASVLGISKMSAANIVQEYVQGGYFVERVEMGKNRDNVNAGRPSFHIYPVSHSIIAIGVYICETEITCSIIDLSCQICVSKSFCPTTNETNQEILDVIDELISYAIKQYGRNKSHILGIGIASVGLVDTEKGIILCADNFPNMQDMHIKDHCEEKFDLPVFVSNDMNAALSAEKYYGNGVGERDFLYIGIGGKSVGVAIYSNGDVVYGHNGFAGELGYTTINLDDSDAYVDRFGWLNSYLNIDQYVEFANADMENREKYFLKAPKDLCIKWSDITREAKRGNKYCLNIIYKIGEYLSLTVVNLINIFDPHKIIIGGHAAAADSVLLDYVNQRIYNKTVKSLLANPKVHARYDQTEIVLAKFGDRVMTIGSGIIMFDMAFRGRLNVI